MPQKGEKVEQLRRFEGHLEKLCKGPLHRQGTWIDSKEFNPVGKKFPGRFRSHCKDCENFQHFGFRNRMVPVSKIQFAVEELIRRLGIAEANRRIGRSPQWFWQFRTGKMRHVQKQTAEAILKALYEVRQNNEVRHRDSIFHGSLARGHLEKRPKALRDFYIRTDDRVLERDQKKREAGKM